MRPEALSFHELNAILIERLGKTRCYVGARWSYLKLFQHALSYSSNNWDHKILSADWTRPWPVLYGRHLLKAILRRQPKRPVFKKVLIVDPGRSALVSGKVVSAYFNKIIGWIGRENTTVITVRDEGMPYSDFFRDALPGPQGAPDRTERSVLRELSSVCRAAAGSGEFSPYEIRQISSSIEVFYTSFRFWYNLLRGQNIQRIIFTSHYHNEGIVAACDVLGIRLDELQHGLIASNDLYNVYPEVFRDAVKNALFPKRIYVYGPYWKRMLLRGCEHSENEIIVAGDYLNGPGNNIPKGFEKKNIILIGAQKRMWPAYEHILKHLTELLKSHPDWSVLIRLHPLEYHPERYHAFVSERMSICPREMSLHECLIVSRIQLSVYSTTFYDALGYEVMNFAVNATGFEQYVSDMVSEGVAFLIEPDDDPIKRFQELKGVGDFGIDRSEVYSEVDPIALTH